MVCMENVFDWFSQLEGHKRIDFICGLLPMCHPLELRFVGSYLEDLAKKDYFILREAELKWNSIQHLCRLVDLSDPHTRSKIITAFALLHSYNTECANRLFLILQSNMQNGPILQFLGNMDATTMQTLLLLTMAVNHPAFSLMQRQEIREMLNEVIKITGIDNQEEDINYDDVSNVNNSFSNESSQSKVVSPQPCVRVVLTDIVVSSSRRREEDKKIEFDIQVHWSNGITIDMCKTHGELLEFHNKLIHLFPDEAGAHRQDRQIPYLHSKRTDEIAQISANVISYMRQMLSLPLKILDSDHVRQFFCDPTFSSSRPVSSSSQRTISSLEGASRWSVDGALVRSNSSPDGSVQRLNTSGEFDSDNRNQTELRDEQRNEGREMREAKLPMDVSNSVEFVRREAVIGSERTVVQLPLMDAGDVVDRSEAPSRSTDSSPRKVDGDTQTEDEFLGPPPENECLPNEVADETEEEEASDVTVMIPPISIPGSPPPCLHPMAPPPPPTHQPRLPANMAPIDLMSALSLRPLTGCLTAYPQTVMTGCTETSTTNRYAYSTSTVAPSPHSSPLPSPLISPRVAGPSLQPALSVLTSGNRPVLLSHNITVPHQIPSQYQQPRYQSYEPPRYHAPPPPGPPGPEQSRYDPNLPHPDSPRYDPRYNVNSCPSSSVYHNHHHYHHVPAYASPTPRYDQRFRDVGRYRSDSPRSNRSRNHSQDGQRGHPPQTIAEWLKLLRLHKYSEQLSKYSVEELMALTEEDLEREGLTKGARRKLLAQIEKCREESRLLNGDVAWQYGPLYPLTIVTVKRYQSGGSSSVDSSASYSDCSSPSPSPLPLRKDSVTSDVEYDKDSDISGSVRSHPSPNQHPPPKLSTNHNTPNDVDAPKPQPIVDQSTHFKPLPLQSQYLDSPTSSPGPQYIYQPYMPVLDYKYIIDRHPSTPHYLDKAPQYHHSSIPFSPAQAPTAASAPPSGCSQCGCNGDCTTAHPPPPLPYPVRFITPAAQLGMYPPTFLTGASGNSLVNPLFHQHILHPNGITSDLLYQTQHNTFFLATASHNHQNSMLSAGQPGHTAMIPPMLVPGNSDGSQFLPVPVSSPVPVTSAVTNSNGASGTGGKPGPKLTCYNCGQGEHKADDCKDATMEAMTHNGQYHLRYGPRGEDDR